MSHSVLLHRAHPTGPSGPVAVAAPGLASRLVGSVWFIGGLAGLLRLPFLHAPVTADEGGFLAVAAQWHHGTSLYGDYWVDRPPMLIALNRVGVEIAHLIGVSPVTGLRILGLIAVALAVAGVGTTARQLAGQSAARWSAIVAAGLLAVPAFGSLDVNGELLSAPFIAWGAAAGVASLTHRPRLMLGLSGVALGIAVMVKQNMVDVGVFVGVLYLCAGVMRLLNWREILRRSGWLVLGIVLSLTAILGCAWLLGTTPTGVYNAMYPFRVASAPLVAALPNHVRDVRLGTLLASSLASLTPIVLIALGAAVARSRRLKEAPALRAGAIACLAVALYDVASITLGGNFWIHYLVELAVPAALAGGLLTRAIPIRGRWVTTAMAAAGLIAYGSSAAYHVDGAGPIIGETIRSASSPSDTIVSALGDADIVESTGLRSPYPYLWSLPAHTLDSNFTLLNRVMAGPERPTWFVVRGPGTMQLMDAAGVGNQLRAHYALLGSLCGRTLYHLRGEGPMPSIPHLSPSDCQRRLVF